MVPITFWGQGARILCATFLILTFYTEQINFYGCILISSNYTEVEGKVLKEGGSSKLKGKKLKDHRKKTGASFIISCKIPTRNLKTEKGKR